MVASGAPRGIALGLRQHAARHEAQKREEDERRAIEREKAVGVPIPGVAQDSEKEFSPERTGTESMYVGSAGRPGAPIDKMFASCLDGVDPSRQSEVAERLAARERDAQRDAQREKVG